MNLKPFLIPKGHLTEKGLWS